MKQNKTVDIIISLLIAIALWVYVISTVNPPQTQILKQIPVAISGQEALEERGLAVAGSLNYTVDVKITGARNDVSSLTKDQLAASADIAALAQGNTYITVSVAAPKGITVDEIISENIAVSVEDFVIEQKPVKLYPGEAPEGFETTVTQLGAETVSVKGAKSDVAKVSYIKTVIPVENLDTDVLKKISVPVLACDASGNAVNGVECTVDSVEYTAAVFTTKQVQLSTDVIGVSLYGTEGIEKIEKPTAITIKGSADLLVGISSVETNVIDVSGISANKTVELTCQLPEGVYLSKSTGPLTASIKISEEAKAAYEAAQNIDSESITGKTGE